VPLQNYTTNSIYQSANYHLTYKLYVVDIAFCIAFLYYIL